MSIPTSDPGSVMTESTSFRTHYYLLVQKYAFLQGSVRKIAFALFSIWQYRQTNGKQLCRHGLTYE